MSPRDHPTLRRQIESYLGANRSSLMEPSAVQATKLNRMSAIEGIFTGLPLEQKSIWAKCRPAVASLTKRIEALSWAGESDRVSGDAMPETREEIEL